ncbi:MAG: dephospho-CoA kinase [Micavibrio sp.]|nr:dephospho-CoA kinase [Micavibrio sp.]
MDKKHSIIAILGMPGAGKSTLVKYLTDTYGFEAIYFGGLVLAEVKRRGLEINQTNEKAVREELRTQNGMAAMAALSIPRIKQALTENKKVLIDGLYSMEELELLQSNFPEKMLTIAIHAARHKREERMAKRPERPLTAEELRNRDLVEIKNINKAPPIVIADYHYVNDGTEQELINWADQLFTPSQL